MQQTSPTYFFHVHIEGHIVVKNDSKIPHSDTEGHPDSGQVKSKEQPTYFIALPSTTSESVSSSLAQQRQAFSI